VGDTAADGLAAVEAAQWAEARALLEQAVADAPRAASAEIRDGLAEALWWCGDLEAALAARERAVAGWRQRGEIDRAVRGAVWIAIEYANGLGHEPASRGWLARAATLAEGAGGVGAAAGWVALGQAALDADPEEQVRGAQRALDVARSLGDAELEVFALARLGWARVVTGSVDAGIDLFDEAMAAATAADFERLSALGDLCCQLAMATETAGESGRFAQWLAVVRRVNSEHGYPPLVAFCATCCAELHTVDGDWLAAEAHLRQGIDKLRGTGHRARCGPPIAKLAELLVLQGRIEEAPDLLGADDSDSTLVARARLALAKGEPTSARALADRWIRRRGDDLLAVGALAIAGQAALESGDPSDAAAIADRIATIAERTGNRRADGAAAILEGEIALDAGNHGAATAAFERALDHYAGSDGLLEVARAHLGLAKATRGTRPEVARIEAKAALVGFERAGATHMADLARAVLRDLGDRSHVGRKAAGLLTDRELDVLRLVARGLTNAEIAQRLFISVKTSGNHVSNILTKIGARSRTEAVAFAALHPEVFATTA
jgi:DNA-binding CsgD family transcriptional regulator/tetratricopeptide (TPR) repeat protein